MHRLGPADPDSEEMEVEGEEGNTGGNIREDPQDIIMNSGELEDDEEKGQDDLLAWLQFVAIPSPGPKPGLHLLKLMYDRGLKYYRIIVVAIF